MRRSAFALCASLLLLANGGVAFAQQPDKEEPPSTGGRPAAGEPVRDAPPTTGAEPAREPPPTTGAEPGGGEPGGGEPGGGEPGARPGGTPGARPGARPGVPGQEDDEKPSKSDSPSYWSDIKVVPRKLILKQKRVELAPTIGVTLNDNLIRHYLIGAAVNYHISDVLSFGVSGHYYLYNLTERAYLVGLQQRVLPTLNKYIFYAGADAAYQIAYGKFAVHNKHILSFGAFISAGVGVTLTEVIPRNAIHEPWQNYNVTVNIGIGFRMFILKWLTLSIAIRDYMMPDKYEASDRSDVTASEAKKNGEQRFINNFVLQIGVTFFLPPNFKYTTFK